MPKTEVKKSKHIFPLLRVGVVVLGMTWAVFWVSREQRWDRLVAIFRQMNWWILGGALGIFIVSQMIIGLRWWLLLRTQSIFIALRMAVRLYFLGWFYNNFMPSSVGGDLIRAWYVSKHTDKRFEAALSVFVDRLIGLASTLVIAAFFYALFLRGQRITLRADAEGGLLASIARHKIVLLWIVAGIGAVFCGLCLHSRGRLMLAKAASHVARRAASLLSKFRRAIVIYCSKPQIMLAAFALTVFLQIMTITGFWFLGSDLGVTVSIKYYYVFFTLTWVLGALPVSVGGAVIVEGLLAYLFIHFAGVQEEAALALALCQRIVWMIASLPGAVIHVVGAHLPKDFFIDYEHLVE
jgi:uncharacterized protein (TIRG00374 family)